MRREALILLAVGALVVPGAAAPADPDDLLLVSASAAGTGGDGESFAPSPSGDGRLVVFSSTASNLHPADTDAEFDVYVKDLATAAVTLVSRSAGGVKGNGRSAGGAISADGTRVAFETEATNLHPSGPGAYLKDLLSGQLLPVSTTAAGVKANAGAGSFSLSADGTRVAFTTTATNLDPRDPVADYDAYVKDLVTGALTLVSLSATGEKKLGLFGAPVATISADGGRVAFHSDAAGLTPNDPDDTGDVFVRELATGALTLASTNDAGVKGNGQSNTPALSADGAVVAFASFATNLDPDMTTAGSSSVYLKDLASGDISLVSRTSAGVPIPGGAFGLSLSADAGRVAFASLSALAHPADTDTVADVYVKDIGSGALFLASSTRAGVKGNGASYPAALAPDGATVAFRSDATNLHAADTDASADVFQKVLGAAAPPPPAGNADLSVTHSDSPDPVLAGGRLNYDIRVRNDGPAPATGVTVLEELDPGVRFESATATPGTCVHAAGAVRCDVGALTVGATAAITVAVTPLQQGTVSARATAQGNEPDADASDNSASALTTVQAAADFSVALTDTPDPARVRDALTYRATVSNAGPSGGAASLDVTLPAAVRLVSASAAGGECRIDRRTVTCFFAAIASGGSAIAAISTSPRQTGTLTASAIISPFLVADADSGNNTDVETTSVVR